MRVMGIGSGAWMWLSPHSWLLFTEMLFQLNNLPNFNDSNQNKKNKTISSNSKQMMAFHPQLGLYSLITF